MEKQLKKWLEEGLLTQEKYLELFNDYKNQKEKTAKILNQITLYIIGAVLLGLGAFLFIGANDWLLELLNNCFILKVGLMFILTASSLYFGYKLTYENKKLPRLGSALIFLSTILIGGTYALIGQNYNEQANTSFLYILWLLSIYPLAFIFKSNAINVLSVVLYVIAGVLYYDNLPYNSNLTPIFIPVILSSFLYLVGNIPKINKEFNNFSLLYKSCSMIVIFITLLCATFDDVGSTCTHLTPYIIPILLLLGFNGVNYAFNKEKKQIARFELVYFNLLMSYLFILLFAQGMLEDICSLLANGFIIALIWGLYKFSTLLENQKLRSLGTKFLTVYLLVNYIRFGSDYFEGGTLFFISGIILVALGLYLERKKRKLK